MQIGFWKTIDFLAFFVVKLFFGQTKTNIQRPITQTKIRFFNDFVDFFLDFPYSYKNRHNPN
jgi:hypothetical protein